MSSITGLDGLIPTIQIIKKTKNIAIANKESLICGWSLIKKNLLKHNTNFLPVDSEHFSIWYALKNNKDECRLLGLWGLTQLADVSTLPLFLETDLKGKGYSRIKSASYCLQFAEKIQKKDAIKIYQHLINTRTLPEEKYLREIAESNLK